MESSQYILAQGISSSWKSCTIRKSARCSQKLETVFRHVRRPPGVPSGESAEIQIQFESRWTRVMAHGASTPQRCLPRPQPNGFIYELHPPPLDLLQATSL